MLCANEKCLRLVSYKAQRCPVHEKVQRSLAVLMGQLDDWALLQDEYGHLTFQIWWDRVISHLTVRRHAERNWEAMKHRFRMNGVTIIKTGTQHETKYHIKGLRRMLCDES